MPALHVPEPLYKQVIAEIAERTQCSEYTAEESALNGNNDISTPRALAMDNTLTHYRILNKPAAYTSAAICICTIQILASSDASTFYGHAMLSPARMVASCRKNRVAR